MRSEAEFIRGDGVHLVEASAGTGKTTWMVRAATQLILGDRRTEARVHTAERLLAVTFTKAATAELKGRLRTALLRAQAIAAGEEAAADEQWLQELCAHVRDPAAVAAVAQSLDRLTVTTIHGFCTGVLEEFPFECGVVPGLRFVERADEYLDEAVADEWRHRRWRQNRLGLITSPAQLRRQAARVRSAIGAERPDRALLAQRIEAIAAALPEHLAALRSAFDRARLDALIAQTKWNTKTPRTAADVAALADAFARYDASGEWDGDLEPWTAAAIGSSANRQPAHAAGRDRLIAEPLFGLATAPAELLRERDTLLAQDAVLAVVERVERAMAAARVVAFDDMVALVERAVRDPVHGPRLRKALADRYDVVLVDEFQDTDWAQWRIFSTVFGDKPLVMVGDPKQSIYKFRGADITAYHEARVRRVAEHTLEINYRSDDGLVRAVQAIFTNHPRPFAVPVEQLDFPIVTARRAEPSLEDTAARPLTLLSAGAGNADVLERTAIRITADEIARLLSDPSVRARPAVDAPWRPVQPNDIAVLVAENRQARLLVRALRRRGVAAVASATGDIADSATWADLKAVIAAVHDHADPRIVRRALASALGGFTASRLRALAGDSEEWRRVLERLADARREWAVVGASQSVLRLLADWRSLEQLASSGEGERRLTDLRQAIGLLQDAERDGAHGPAATLAWMRRFADERDEHADTRQLQLESDADAVQVSTVHGAKGLEYGIVFCPFLWRGKAHSEELPRVERAEDGSRRVVFTARDSDELDPEANGESERLRLAYVALTRAKWRTYCVVGAREGRAQWQSGPLLHLLAGTAAGAEALASKHPDLICVGVAQSGASLGTAVPAAPPPVLSAAARSLTARQRSSWGVTSYTGLTRRLKSVISVDHAPRLDDVESATSELADDTALPGGAHTGDALHEMLELLDYEGAVDDAALDAVIASTLYRYALPWPDATAEQRHAAHALAKRMLVAALSTPFDETCAPLSRLPRSASFREWRFHLSVSQLSAQAIAASFRRFGAPWLADGYAASLNLAPVATLEGFLTGVVDLVAMHDGRWWVVDWKTNTLGDTRAHYAESALRQAMQQHHFVLQYHVYVLALHRFLRSRLGARYDYDRDFGGVGYAFLRGLAAGAPAWFRDRPSRALVEDLDATLSGGTA